MRHAHKTGVRGRTASAGPVDTGAVPVALWDPLFQYWRDKENSLNWNCIYVLPPWLKAWWQVFGKGMTPYVSAVWHRHRLVGIAPLVVHENAARFMGDADLCDFSDFIVVPGQETLFFRILLAHLRKEGITSLHAGPVRSDSPVIPGLKGCAEELGGDIVCNPAGSVYELHLPQGWEEYLHLLSAKERHEIQRKLRRLHETGSISYRVFEEKDEVEGAMDIFITLFRRNIVEKADFMTPLMESFFRTLAAALAEYGLLRLSVLHVDETPAAATMCVDYGKTFYLYNNGYDRIFGSLSAGLLSKVYSIQDSIRMGRATYDFLKGDEAYKGRLGGVPVQLYQYEVRLN